MSGTDKSNASPAGSEGEGKSPSPPRASEGKIANPLTGKGRSQSPGQEHAAKPQQVMPSLLQTAVPPKGKDPKSHGTDTAKNLSDVAKSLAASGDKSPKILTAHNETTASGGARPSSLGSGPAVNTGKHAPAVGGLGIAAGGSGVTEVNPHLVTDEFLAAAAEKFLTFTAEDIITTIMPIVPFFAACRVPWVSKQLSGALLVLTQTPETTLTMLGEWTKASGEKLLTVSEAKAVVMTIAKIIKQTGNQTGPFVEWAKIVPKEAPRKAEKALLQAFTTLNAEQTFAFVVKELPHLEGIRQAWIEHGLTSRELRQLHPIGLIEILDNFHEVVAGTQKLLPYSQHRIREAVMNMLVEYRDQGVDLDEIIDQHVEYAQQRKKMLERHLNFTGVDKSRPDRGGGAGSMHGGGVHTAGKTPAPKASSPFLELENRIDDQDNNEHTVTAKRLLVTPARSSGVKDTSFLDQFGVANSGTKLYRSGQQEALTIARGEGGNITLQTATPVVSDYKMFSDYTHQGWTTFIKAYRDETARLPKASRRALTDLVTPAVIEQLRDEWDFGDWEDVQDDDVLNFCFKQFGPKTARDAQTRLTAVKFYFNDARMEQSTFTPKLVKFFTEKLTMLGDFAISAKYWEENDKLTRVMLYDALVAMFPVDDKITAKDGKTLVLRSSNNAKIRTLLRENKDKTFKEATVFLKAHFRDRDTRVATCDGASYDVEPWLKTSDETVKDKPRDTSRDKGDKGPKTFKRKGVNDMKAKREVPAKKQVTKSNSPRCNNCGKRGHTANDDECLLWGHPQAKGAKGTWADDEKSLHLEDSAFKSWCESRTAFFEKPHNKKNKTDSKGAAGGKTKFNPKVNSSQCPEPPHAHAHAEQHDDGERRNVANIGSNSDSTAFHAIGRFTRNIAGRAPRAASVLMDPGAEINLMRTDIIKGVTKASTLKVLDTKQEPVDLFNNGVKIGHVTTSHLLRFTLDTVESVATIAYEAWFHAWDDMEEDAILGAEFNRTACFTNYHNRLVPYSTLLHKAKNPARTTNDDDVIMERDAKAREWGRPRRDPDESGAAQERSAATDKERMKPFDELRNKHHKASVEALSLSSKHPWMCRPLKRVPTTTPVKKDHSNYERVDYNQLECEQLTAHLARSYCEKQQNILKKLDTIGKAEGNLTAEEDAVLADAARACAKESADFFKTKQHLLGNKTWRPNRRTERYFMDGPAEPAPKAANPGLPEGPKFPNRHVCVLQNLINRAELNGTPVRIISWNEEERTYNVGISNPRGYWTCREEFLRSLDPAPKPAKQVSALKQDLTFADCGIDTESGQPTLDPLERPVHRQYGKQVSAELTARIADILKKFEDVFGKDITQPCKFRPMKIELIPNKVLPANPRYWRNSPAQRAEVRVQLQSMIDMKIVRASDTAIASNVLMVKRPGMPGKFRFTVDMRVLNDATVPMPWQMPEVQQQLDRLSNNNIFGCIDLSSYYHQIELDAGSRFLTGFITEDGVFEYNRVAMGLKNACAHAQSQLQKAIDEDPILKRYNVRNYFDDIPLGAKSEDEFCELLEAILSMGRRFNLKFNREKSIFGVDSITHVGFVVNSAGVEVDPMRLDALREIAEPQSMKGTQSVLGAWNYIRNFIPNFSSRALPLTDLVGSVKGANGKKKPKPFVWTDKCQAAFEDLKQATLNTKLLANMDFTKEIFIRCDSSQFGAGAVLFQLDEHGLEQPIAYASRKYTLAERNYCTFQQEAAAVVWALEKFACFFQGHPVTVQSDHKNLSWVKKSAMPQLTRWRLRLEDFDFRLEYLPGPLNVCADGLSRIGVDDKDMMISISDVLPAHAAEQSLLQGGQTPHRALNTIYMNTKRGRGRSHAKTVAETIWDAASDDENDDQVEEPTDEPWPQANFNPINRSREGNAEEEAMEPADNAEDAQIAGDHNAEIPALPAVDAGDIIGSVHNDMVGHAGVLTTLQRILRTDKAWASRSQMIADIDAFLAGCVTCQKFRKRHNRSTDQRFHIAGSPFSELSVDILHLPKRDCNNNLYVVVIVDSFTRWLTCVPVADKSALSAARAILQTVGNFGNPLTIRSDGGGEFINDTISALERVMGVKHHKITPYLHEGNSLAEKANRSVLENLRNLIFDKRYDLNGEHQWSDLLPLAQRIINASFNSSIGCSPAQLVFGDNLELDRCILTAMPPAITVDAPTYIHQLAHNQRILMDAADKILSVTHAKNLKKWKQNHQSNTSLQQMLQAAPEAGVWVLARIRDDAPLEKWKPRWAGPFKLLDFKSQTQSIVRLWDTIGNKVIEAHLNDVELWNHKFTESVEGLTKVAEYDGWVYPMDGIVGMALTPLNEDDEHVPLDLARPRATNKTKYAYSFCVKWRNYEEPSWVKFNAIKDTITFQAWAASHPVLKF